MTLQEQLAALEALVNVCTTTQLRHVHELVEPMLQRDFVSLLPREVSRLSSFTHEAKTVSLADRKPHPLLLTRNRPYVRC